MARTKFQNPTVDRLRNALETLNGMRGLYFTAMAKNQKQIIAIAEDQIRAAAQEVLDAVDERKKAA